MAESSRLRRQVDALNELTRRAGGADTLDDAFHALTEVAADTLGVAQAGVWLFDEHGAVLVCHDLYEVSTKTHSAEATILRAHFPRYFAALDTSRAIDASDAATDPRTSELAEAYLEPHGVGALLDAPILVGGELVGAVCMEHVGPPRTWTVDEQAFAGSIADLASTVITRARQQETEEVLRQREATLRLALEAARMGTWCFDMRTNDFTWSAESGPLYGHTEGWAPTDLHDAMRLIHPDDRDAVVQSVKSALERDDAFVTRHRVELPSGEVRWIEARGRRTDASRVLGTIADVTAEHDLQDQVLHAQKMDGLGRLAGGIAHDFNNLLTAIGSCAELLGDQLADQPTALSLLGIIDRSADRAAELTRRLLAFARRQAAEPRVIDLRDVIRDLEPILGRLLREDIEVQIATEDAPLVAHIDPTHLEQILVNLVVNAGDAMAGGGALSIRADTETVTDRDPSRPIEATPGRYVRLIVSDTGHGMDAHTLAHLFEPFFTTKPLGTGLGLATSYGIARQAGGHIRVASEPGRGSTFEVWLPRHAGPVDAPDVTAAARAQHPVGTETLLLVEDDSRIRELSTLALRGRGYRVLAAGSGEEALSLARRHPRRIDLLVSDVVMPGGGGCWLAEQLRAADPEVPVLLISGYGDTPAAPTGGAAFLSKPFTTGDLVTAVRSALDASAPR